MTPTSAMKCKTLLELRPLENAVKRCTKWFCVRPACIYRVLVGPFRAKKSASLTCKENSRAYTALS